MCMSLIFLVSLSLLMYFEGLLASMALIGLSPLESRLTRGLAVLIWPFGIPYIAYKVYSKYKAYMNLFLTNFEGSSLAIHSSLDFTSPASIDAINELQKQFEEALSNECNKEHNN